VEFLTANMAMEALTLLGAATAAYDGPENVHEAGCCIRSLVADLQTLQEDGALTLLYPIPDMSIIGELVHGW